jgi:hypothetical protein
MACRSLRFIPIAAMLVALVVLPARAAGQTATFGVQGGVTISNVDFSSDIFSVSFDNRLGGVGGFLAAVDFTPSVGLQVDVLYLQGGTKSSNAFFEEAGDLEIRVDYLEVPVLVRGNFRASDVVTVRLFGGPAFGFKLSDKQTLGGEELGSEDKLDIKSYDVGLAFGGAVQFGKFFVDGRYMFGLVNIDDDPEDEGFVEIKTRAFTFMVGFAF